VTVVKQKQLNGPQTTGREYRNLSAPEHGIRHDVNVETPMRDGISLMTDVHRPDADGRFPALIAASPLPAADPGPRRPATIRIRIPRPSLAFGTPA
jgi:predicted acyl esterase